MINQFLSSSAYILKTYKSSDDTTTQLLKSYVRCLCFLIIRAHDPNLLWFKKFLNGGEEESSVAATPTRFSTEVQQQQRQYSPRFDPAFFHFLFEAEKTFAAEPESSLALHTYACMLSNDAHNNTERAITPASVEFLFGLLLQQQQQQSVPELLFYDKRRVVCRCVPLVVNVLHVSLPDKRQVELAFVLDKCIACMLELSALDMKLEMVACYANMLRECVDRAALKICIASVRFFVALMEQLRQFVVVAAGATDAKKSVYVTLKLIKTLMEDSQAVKVTDLSIYLSI